MKRTFEYGAAVTDHVVSNLSLCLEMMKDLLSLSNGCHLAMTFSLQPGLRLLHFSKPYLRLLPGISIATRA